MHCIPNGSERADTVHSLPSFVCTDYALLCIQYLPMRLFISIVVGLLLPGWVSGQTALLSRADSLFAAGNQAEAAPLYEQVMAGGYAPTDAMLLKLASANERQNNAPRLLYYLQLYFDHHPNDAVLRKMSEVAQANNLTGYEIDDLNYFYLFYRKYNLYVFLFLFIPAGYGFGVFLLKRRRQQGISGRQKGTFIAYLFLLLIFINLPKRIQTGITSGDRVLLRVKPSGAASVAEIVGRGNKMNIFGTKDIYLRVLWRNQIYYVRRDEVWVI